MGPLMLRPSPRLRLMPRPTTMVVMDSVPTVATDWELTATDTVPMAMATPPTPDTDTTMVRGPLMLRPSPRLMLMLRLTTMVAMDSVPTVMDWELMVTDIVPMAMATPAMLMATVPTAMAPMDTVPMPMVPTHTPMEPTTTKLLIPDLLYKK